MTEADNARSTKGIVFGHGKPPATPPPPKHASIDPVTEPASIVFEVPKVRWPTEGTFTLIRDLDVQVGSTFTLTDRAGEETVYRVTHVDEPDDDDPNPRWTVSVVEWSPSRG